MKICKKLYVCLLSVILLLTTSTNAISTGSTYETLGCQNLIEVSIFELSVHDLRNSTYMDFLETYGVRHDLAEEIRNSGY